MKRFFFIAVLGAVSLTACGFFPWDRSENLPSQFPLFSDKFSSNGERIYFTATNEDGERIDYTGGPAFGGMMMGSYLSCASCHGVDGRGGTHVMHMQVMDAPDIRFAALSGEGGEHGDGHEHEHQGEYNLDTFRLAVVEGQHPDGDSLDWDMPRWIIGQRDLADLFEFLKSLP